MSHGNLAVVAWVVESSVLVQTIDGVHLLFGQGEAEQIKILFNSLLVIRLWNDCDLSLKGPLEQNLSWRFADSGSNILDNGIVIGSLFLFSITEADVSWGAQAAVTGDSDSVREAVFDKSWLSIQWMELDLEDRWFDLGVGEDISDQRGTHVTDADGLNETLVVELLHGSPRLVNWHWIFKHGTVALWMIGPLWWVMVLEWNVLERNWEMNQVEVDVVEAEVLEGPLASWLDVLLSMLGVPELGGDEEILTLDDTLIDGSLDALTGFLFVAIYGSLINESVAQLDGIVNAIGAFVVIDLPASEANCWHFCTGVQGILVACILICCCCVHFLIDLGITKSVR